MASFPRTFKNDFMLLRTRPECRGCSSLADARLPSEEDLLPTEAIIDLPYRIYKDSSDKVAEKQAQLGECFITGKKLDALSEYAEKVMKLDLKSYDIDSTKKILSGISLSAIVSEMRAAKYEKT